MFYTDYDPFNTVLRGVSANLKRGYVLAVGGAEV
jgi:hypothetical protein